MPSARKPQVSPCCSLNLAAAQVAANQADIKAAFKNEITIDEIRSHKAAGTKSTFPQSEISKVMALLGI